MNKFAKYLPVEGEIKEGDYAKDKTGLVWQVSKKDHMISNTDKKVKLFLCSRDIQVGDKVQWQYNEWEVEAVVISIGEEVEIECDGTGKHFKVPPSELYKVIGEISPDATWVKEGDEFDEDDVAGLVALKAYDFDPDKLGYMIKGPCGHFH